MMWNIIHIMSRFHSYVEEVPPHAYRPRWAAGVVRALAEDFPVTVLTGARQVGKSTLLRREEPFRQWRYVTLDDFDALDAAMTDPASLWTGTQTVVLDEVQKAPAVLSAVKAAIDGDPSRRFVLSGSANLLLMSRVSESLAGRAAYLELGPLALGEEETRAAPTVLADMLAGVAPTRARATSHIDALTVAQRGMMPRFLSLPARATASWWDGYVATYLERDLRTLSHVSSLSEFRRLMEVLALRSGQLLNRSEAARDVGLSQATAHRYIGLMEVSAVLTLLRAFAGNRSSRLVKAPKPYLFDSGLAAFLSGHYEHASLLGSREAGAVFETFVLQHIRVLCQLMSPRPKVHYWRTVAGREVDVVVEHGRSIVGLEIKLSERAGYRDTAGLRAFKESTPGVSCCAVVYCGTEIAELADGIFAVPWSEFAG